MELDLQSLSLIEQLLDREIKSLDEQAQIAQSHLGADHPNVSKLRGRLAYARRTRELIDPVSGYDRRSGRQAA
jgi:hypothetical protein